MLWVSQEQRIFYVNLWHVCKVVLLHVGRDWFLVSVLFHLAVILRFIYRMGLISAFGEVPVIYPLSVILV